MSYITVSTEHPSSKTREGKGARELDPHIGPLPIVIPLLKIFLVTKWWEIQISERYLLSR